MAADFYVEAAQKRYEQLEASRSQALADLQSAKASGDSYLATEAVQTIANCDAEARNLSDLAQRYERSQQPTIAPVISREERMARPLDKMNYDDALEIARSGSKYGAGLTHDDPYVRAGYAEVQRRRARGE